jgi:hypothetical protein
MILPQLNTTKQFILGKQNKSKQSTQPNKEMHIKQTKQIKKSDKTNKIKQQQIKQF